MAQSDNPYGLTPYCPNGTSPKIAYMPEKSGASFKVGDPLLYSSGVDFATTNSTFVGVAAQDSTGTAGAYVAVWADPQQWFIVKTDGTGASLTPWAEVDLVGATTGLIMLNPDASSNDDVLAIGPAYPNSDDLTAAGARWIVQFKVHEGHGIAAAT